MNDNQLFAENTNGVDANSTRALSGTAQLTNLAATLGNTILAEINERMSSVDEQTVEEARSMLKASQKDHGAMDNLINAIVDISAQDLEFIKILDEPTIDGMLKSQQSKRSRAKGKVMTKENYISMLTGAIAENLIRAATGKSKQSGRRTAGTTEFSEETLKKLAADQTALRRELRNVQSKKSIMKSKEGFDPESEGWLALLKAEEQLKAIRIAGAGGSSNDPIRSQIAELLAQLEVGNLSKKDANDILAQIAQLTLVQNSDNSDSADKTADNSDSADKTADNETVA